MSELDHILALMEKYTFNGNVEGEIGEQDVAGGGSTGGSTGGYTYPTVTKWETGLARSVANTIDDKTTWKSLNKLTRGKANTLL